MNSSNIEIKAKSNRQEAIRKVLQSKKADFRGVDRQIDTYFKVGSGRLKLREGNIENFLVHYLRNNQTGPKQSDFILFKTVSETSLKEVLTKALGVLAVVDKKREIYFIENVKFHIDEVAGLGTFVEIEAIDSDSSIGQEKLMEQCRYYMELFGIADSDLLDCSYSDMVIAKANI